MIAEIENPKTESDRMDSMRNKIYRILTRDKTKALCRDGRLYPEHRIPVKSGGSEYHDRDEAMLRCPNDCVIVASDLYA